MDRQTSEIGLHVGLSAAAQLPKFVLERVDSFHPVDIVRAAVVGLQNISDAEVFPESVLHDRCHGARRLQLESFIGRVAAPKDSCSRHHLLHK